MQKYKNVEGKYNWSALFSLYQGLQKDHVSKGMAEFLWNHDKQKYDVNVIVTLFPKENPEKIMSAIVFEGFFDTKNKEKVNKGDILYLNHVKRIGIGYSSKTSNPPGHYKYDVVKVEYGLNNNLKTIIVEIDNGRIKGSIQISQIIE